MPKKTKRKSRRLSTSDDEKDMSKKAKKRKSRRRSTFSSEDDEKDMSKKAKKRKSRRLSTSSSEDDEKRTKNTNETTKHKHVPSKEKSDVAGQKSKDPSSSKEEAQSKRQIKKPVYRLEKTQPARGQSPIFKEEESKSKAKHSMQHKADISSEIKNSESSSSKDRWVASFSQDIFIPRSVSAGQKTEGQSSSVTKKLTEALKAKEVKKSSLVPRVVHSLFKNDPVEKKQHHQEQIPLKTKLNTTLSGTAFSKGASATSGKPKTSPVPDQRREKKELPIVSPQLASKIPKKTTAAEKSTVASKSHLIKKDLKTTSCEAKSSCTVESSLRESRTPAAHKKTTTAPASGIKTAKASPGHQMKCTTVPPQPPSTLSNFKIPKKTCVTETSSEQNNKTLSTNNNLANSTCEATTSVPQLSSSITPSSNLEDVQKQDPWPFFMNAVSPASHAGASPWQDQMMVVEQLHQARTEKRLEVNVLESYGELTCMEIDPPEEGAADTPCKELPQQDVIIVLDTNILISHLDYVKKIVSRGLEVVFPVVLIPWVVLQELDSLKKGRGLSGSVAHSAIPAISYIYNCLKGKESRLWGQSMQQAAQSTSER